MTRCYLDSSVALHAVLPDGDRRARTWLDEAVASGGEVYSSSLLRLELSRVVRRERLDVVRVRPLMERIYEVSIDDGVLRFAGAIEPHVRSLDSIHLATCLLLGSGLTLVTHDAGMARAGDQLGLDTLDPLSRRARRS